MYAAKIQHNTCKVYDAKSGSAEAHLLQRQG